MKLVLRDRSDSVMIDRLPAYLIIDEHGWIDVYYDVDSARRSQEGSREGGTDCTIYTLDLPNSEDVR